MVTKKKAEQYKQLVETLKFTPCSYTIRIQGYGGESYAGRVERRIYDYFKSRSLDLEQYANDWDNELKVPEDLQPFPPGSAYDCDNIFHSSGAELSNLNIMSVDDEHGNEVWSIAPGSAELLKAGIAHGEVDGADLDDLELDPNDTVVVWGGQGEKGCFFEGEFELRAPFDPKLLSIGYVNCDGWLLISSVEYNGEEIDGFGGYSTTGKWAETKWVLSGDEEVYAGEEQFPDDDDEVEEDAEEDSVPPVPEVPKTEWYPMDVKPAYKGEYEVDLGPGVAWPFTRIVRAEWTGRTWRNEDGKKLTEQVAWRGLAIDPNTTFDWSPSEDNDE